MCSVWLTKWTVNQRACEWGSACLLHHRSALSARVLQECCRGWICALRVICRSFFNDESSCQCFAQCDYVTFNWFYCAILMFTLPVSASHYADRKYMYCSNVWKISRRWFGVPGHASPPASAHQEPKQWNSGPSEDQHHGALGARGPVHTVLLHALPTDGMGEPQCWALQSHLTNRKVSP